VSCENADRVRTLLLRVDNVLKNPVDARVGELIERRLASLAALEA
jgi:hypothetical protein